MATASIWNPSSQLASQAIDRISYDTFIASAGQTVFTLSNATAAPGSNNVLVQVDGLFYPFEGFTVNSAKQLTLTEPLDGGETVVFISINALVLGAPLSNAQFNDILTESNDQARSTALASVFGLQSTIPRLEVIAHRGFVDILPQNTILAFTAAKRRGADSLECDVRMTSDGVGILYHDNNLNTSTSGTGAVESVTFAYTQGLTYNALVGTAFSATRIATFQQMLKFARNYGMTVYPEIKSYRTQADITILLNNVYAEAMQDLCVLQSFNINDLNYIRGLDANIGIGFLGASYIVDYEVYVDQLAILGKAVLIWDKADLILRPAIVTYCRSKNVDVIAYTINNLQEAFDVARAGVRRIMTDVPLEA